MMGRWRKGKMKKRENRKMWIRVCLRKEKKVKER